MCCWPRYGTEVILQTDILGSILPQKQHHNGRAKKGKKEALAAAADTTTMKCMCMLMKCSMPCSAPNIINHRVLQLELQRHPTLYGGPQTSCLSTYISHARLPDCDALFCTWVGLCTLNHAWKNIHMSEHACSCMHMPCFLNIRNWLHTKPSPKQIAQPMQTQQQPLPHCIANVPTPTQQCCDSTTHAGSTVAAENMQ